MAGETVVEGGREVKIVVVVERGVNAVLTVVVVLEAVTVLEVVNVLEVAGVVGMVCVLLTAVLEVVTVVVCDAMAPVSVAMSLNVTPPPVLTVVVVSVTVFPVVTALPPSVYATLLSVAMAVR